MGISLWPENAEKADDILTFANLALKRAKEAGKNNYQYYIKNEWQAHIQHIEKNLKNVLDLKELYICYQPQIDSNSKKIIGFEALLRWDNVEFGSISPAMFIPIAEKTGQIVAIGEWVLQKACLEAAKWQKEGKEFRVSVNVSVCQLQDNDGSANNQFIKSVEYALEQASLKPELLELEITESILMQVNDETLKGIKKLKKLGVRIACDDFGIGYSSYARILKLPLDTIKIDQSLIVEINKKWVNTTTIIGCIIAMNQQLGIKTIAEGVETQEQFDVLQNLKCDVIQGNYLLTLRTKRC